VTTPGRVVWHDLVTQDLEGAKKFYGSLFGWTFKDYETERAKYSLASLDGRPVAGILRPAKTDINNSQWLPYFSVDDVDATAKAATAAGARVQVEPLDIKGRGRAALLVDPEGAPFAVLRLTGGDPEPRAEPALNGWLWIDLWTRDAEKAQSFYGKLFGFDLKSFAAVSKSYRVWEREGRHFGGIIPIPVPDVSPNWLPLLRVASAPDTVSKAEQLGGRVILAPRADIRGGSAGIIADPSGGAVAVQEWPIPTAGAGVGAR
jgi:predicted enzyme related to lactoylglutathione lyase